jgi:hypothetical protein
MAFAPVTVSRNEMPLSLSCSNPGEVICRKLTRVSADAEYNYRVGAKTGLRIRPNVSHVSAFNRTAALEVDVVSFIHDTIVRSDGYDPYTGDALDWHLVGKFNSEDAKAGGAAYKAQFKNLPTVDHVDPSSQALDFEIISWFINDAKSDLTRDEFVNLCRRIVERSEAKIAEKENSD